MKTQIQDDLLIKTGMNDQRIFFLTTIPGLESVSHLELCEKWGRAADFFNLPPYPEVQFFKGGLEFQAPLAFGFLLNRYLRTSTRLLLRETKFQAPSEQDFIKGLKKIPWQRYFSKNSFFDYKFTAKSSKISMDKQVSQVLEGVLKKHNVKYKVGAPTIFVRLFRDECNISLDCTGEAGYKRGGNKKGSIASLRESTASGLLRTLFQGIRDPFVVIDPMCGSGTFLNESLLINSKLQRSFAFEEFPVAQELEQIMMEGSEKINIEGIKPEKVFGYDFNDKAIQVAKSNASDFSAEYILIKKADLLDKAQGRIAGTKLKKVVVINPPWGERLPAVEADVLKAVYDKYQPDRIGFLMPAHWKLSPIPLEKVKDKPIVNSGIENRFVVFA